MTETVVAYIAEINSNTQLFNNEFGNLSAEELDWKPKADVWSIAQNIEHLISTTQAYYPMFDELLKGQFKKPLLGHFNFVANFFGNFIIKAVNADGRWKSKTAKFLEPASSEIGGDILHRFEACHHQLIEQVKRLENLFGKKTLISSALNRQVVYTLDRCFDIMLEHERRHFNQAKGLLALKSSTKA